MTYQNIIAETGDGVAVVTINRPAVHNALDPRTWAELRDAVRACRGDRGVHAVIITGAGGKAFASGADIRSLRERRFLDVLWGEAQETLNDIENLERPVIAAIDGYALGGGCELALACDLRIATTRSKFGQPEVGLGLIPGAGGTQRLQRLVGIGKAKELIFTGEIIDALEAVRIGLVNKVVQPEELMSAAREMAAAIAARGPVAVALAKMAVNVGANADMQTGLMFEKCAQAVVFATQDRLEGTTAYIEKRKPVFKGE